MNKRISGLICVFALLFTFASCTGTSEQTTDQQTYYGTVTGSQTRDPIETIPEPNINTDTAQTDPPDTSDNTNTDISADDTRLSFICAGDNIIHEAVFKNAETSDGYDFSHIYEEILPFIKDADISYINQESPICGDSFGITGYPSFNSPESLGDFLIGSGFDVISLANNHMFDYRLKGFEGMLKYWDKKDVLSVGAYKNENDYDNIRILEKNGVKIAFLSYTDFINSSKMSTYNELKKNGDTDVVIPLTDHDKIKEQIKYAKSKADLVFVGMHWGEEDEFKADSSQKKTAQVIADAGADVIIGSHPHVVQDIEWIKGTNGNDTLCIYSLGNILSTMEPARNLVGMMVGFDIVKNSNGAYVENIEAIPVVTYYEYHPDHPGNNAKRINVKLYLLENFTEEQAASHGCNDNEDHNKDLDDFKSYITDNVNKKYLK